MPVKAIDAKSFEDELYSLLALQNIPITVSVLLEKFTDKDERQILRSLMRMRNHGRVLLKRNILRPKREPEFVAVTKSMLDGHRIKS